MKKISLKGTYLGFTDNKKPMQAGRIEKTLDSLIRIDGKVMTEKEFIYNKLQEGYKPHIEENYSYYSVRLKDYTKPKNDYRIKLEDGSFYSIPKTLYEFAHHIINNGFLDIEKTKQFIQEEQHKKEELEQLEKERARKEREEAEQKRKQEEQKKREERERKQKEWYELGKQYFTNEVKQKLLSVLDKYWNDIKSMYPDTNKDEFYANTADHYIRILGNQAYCKHWLQSYVEQLQDENGYKYTMKNNPSRTIEQDFLLSVFNVTKEDKNRTIAAKVKAFYKGKEYKGNNNSNIKMFHAFSFKDNNYKQVIGEEIKVDNFSFFIVKNDTKSYDIYELKSGAKLSDGYTNKKDTIKKLNELVASKKEQIEKAVEVFIKNNGYSPNVQKQTI